MGAASRWQAASDEVIRARTPMLTCADAARRHVVTVTTRLWSWMSRVRIPSLTPEK